MCGLLFLAGCLGKTGQPEPEGFPVSGAVSFDGKPLAEGLIQFKTIAVGAIDSLEVKGGEIAVKAQAGNRWVEICAYETIQPTGEILQHAGPPAKRNLIPAQYNQESKLTANVTREGPNRFTFEFSR